MLFCYKIFPKRLATSFIYVLKIAYTTYIAVYSSDNQYDV